MKAGRWGVAIATWTAAAVAACWNGEGERVAGHGAALERVSNKTCVAPPRDIPFPAKLSQLGCFESGDARKVLAGVVAYEPQAPLWSDGAGKPRYFAIPDGTAIRIAANGHFEFPNGTVLLKTFVLGGRFVETRVFVRFADGGWGGYSYEWNDAQTDATLLSGAKTKSVSGQTWSFPNRSQCLRCHNDNAGVTLGPEIAQLNGPSESSSDNQLDALAAAGYFDAPLAGPTGSLPRLARYDSNESPERRARAYLHGNCSHCHRPGGPGGGSANYRFDVPFGQMNVCDAPAGSDPGQVLFAPGSSATSEISTRMHALDGTRMPALGTAMVDPVGTALVDGWIDETRSCDSSAVDGGPDSPHVGASAFASCDHDVSFEEVQAGALASCGGLACHVRPPLAAKLDLSPAHAYDALVNARSTVNPDEVLVVPGDPSRSFAWHKLIDKLGSSDGTPMPRGLSRWRPVDDDSLRVFRCWIEQGAPREAR
jgi:uncharacterized repeat protein (TIGR03806 family)